MFKLLRGSNQAGFSASRFRVFLFWAVLATAFHGSGSLGAESASGAPVAGQRVFVTAHSFHIFVADRLGPLAKAAGISGHELVGKQMIGGSRVRQHWDLPDGENLAKKALLSGGVDVLTMSHNWLVPDDGIELFADLGLEHNPRLRGLVQISWPAFDHWEAIGNPALWDPARKINHNEERDARPLDGPRAANAGVKAVVEKQVAALNAKYGRDVISIVPVGDAVLQLRERVVAGTIPGIKRESQLFSDPIGHAKAAVMALASYCNFACIYGRSPVGLDDGDRELDRIDPKLRGVLQEIAWDTVTSYAMSGVTKDGQTNESPAKEAVPKDGAVRRAPANADSRLSMPAAGVPIAYTLPADGPLPRTYRVTLAITDVSDPNWIVSAFLSGEPRTVTAENMGHFTDTWDGLDDNFMPAPPGTYGVKGIFLPAEIWPVDGKPHTLTAKLAGGPFAFLPRPDQDTQPPKVHGDPVNSPPGDVGTFGESAVFTWTYLENGTNNFVLDLTKPVGLDQIVGSANSGGAAGGAWTATDGSGVWTVGEDFGRPYIYRSQGKWGPERAMYREGVVLLDGVAAGLAASRESDRSFVYVAEAAKVERKGKDRAGRDRWTEGESRIDRVTVLDGENGKKLAAVDLPSPVAITVRNGMLFAVQRAGDGFAIRSMRLAQGLPVGEWSMPIVLTGVKSPTDVDVDSSGRIYVADPAANHVFVFDATGRALRAIGKSDSQTPGHYDRLTLMGPRRVSCWNDGKRDRVIVMEGDGPGRFAEWSSDGELIREWQGLVPHANNGYAEDPAHPDHIYIQGHGEYLLRFVVSNETGLWTLDAVWPHVTGDLGGTWRGEGSFPRMVRRDGRLYLVYGRGLSVYRFDDDRCLASAALVLKVDGKNRNYFAWHDADGDGTMQDGEVSPEKIEVPRGVFGYHGDGWQHDFSLLCPGEGTRDIWRLAPESFDAHGNPVFVRFTKLLTDPIMAAKAAGNAPAVRGGNEISDTFNSAWRRVVLTPTGDVLTDIRCGALSANHGTEQKISRYVPDGKGGYDLRWRIGRSANIRASRDGFVGSIQMTEPMHGLIGVVDQSRAGVQVFTADEGLYVDTLLLDGSFGRQTIYGAPGEFFSGGGFLNNDTGKVSIKWGKHTPIMFEAVGWTKDLAIRRIAGLPTEVTLTAAQTAPPPPVAMVVRGGAGKAPFARFQPSPGGPPALDGAIDGWESSEAITFGEGECKVEVRGMYDLDHLYLRWYARSDAPIRIRPLEPADRLFTHDRGADTFGVYFQGSPSATGKDPAGRPGDLRLVVGLFDVAGKTVPAALSMYPSWNGPGAHPVTYGSPVGKASLAHVALATQARLAHRLDADGKGLTLAAAIPRSILPAETPDWSEGLRTTIDFDANFGGNRKLWWSNADGSASRETNDEPTEARLYPAAWGPLELATLTRGLYVRQWQVIGPFGFGKLPQLDVRAGRGEICATLANLKFPPELQGDVRDGGSAAGLVWRDLSGRYDGDMARTRKMNRVLTWVPVTITDDEVDFRKIARLKWNMHDEEGVAYMVTWVHAAEASDVTLTIPEVHGHRAIRGWLNGEPLPVSLGDGKREADLRQRIDASRPMSLRKGWNELLIRVDHIWGDSEITVRLDAPATTLWKLRTSNEQPAGTIVPASELPASLPWDLAALSQSPAVEWLDETAPVRSLLYAGEPFQGHPTRVFAYYATPASICGESGAVQDAAAPSKGPWPGVVLVHGGGGTAFAEWVTLWAKRGYAAIAMDLAGSRPDPAGTKKNAVIRLPDGGPDQTHKDKFDTMATPETSDDWPYHAVANVIRGHSLLRSLPGVDPSRTAITGISWGGYTTCLVASLDNRFRAAVPVYGCGHLRDNSCWLGDFERIGPEQSTRWTKLYDPGSYLPACRVPIFFLNGTNDFAYPLDSYGKSYADVQQATKNIRIQVNMPHGHEAGWAPKEIAAFIDSKLLGTAGLPVVDAPVVDDRGTRCRVAAGGPVASAALVSTSESGPINKLTWQTVPAEVGSDGTLTAPKPPADARAFFFTGTTPAGLQVSSPVVIVPDR